MVSKPMVDHDTPFSERLEQHSAWRQLFAQRLQGLSEWLQSRELLDDAVQDLLTKLQRRMRSDKITVAFVAEFSRGKSELINALFFADYGRRIMPASAGRTTMCPTEIGFDAHTPPSLRLLPIQTRSLPLSLAELRVSREHWTEVPLNVQDAEQLARSLQQVSETIRVDTATAQSLGLWHSDGAGHNPVLGGDGLVELPRWRHAVINIAHPLLRQGLVVLDTPGLNAIGAEPELTVSMIPQADAVVFMLAADTGVTQSDLSIWQDHLDTPDLRMGERLVVLNKIDTLWDGMNSAQEVNDQVQRQRLSVAEVLKVPVASVLAVSAQKGLLAKVRGDAALLGQSCLRQLESRLADHTVGQRQDILRQTVLATADQVNAGAGRRIHMRRRELAEQVHELRALSGKNAGVVRVSKQRVEAERAEFEQAGARFHAVKAVQLKLLQQVYQKLGGRALTQEMESLSAALTKSGIKLGLQREYGQMFDRLRATLAQAQQSVNESHAMLQASFSQINADLGLQLQAPPPLSLLPHQQELDRVEQAHLKYVKLGNTLALLRQDAALRLVRLLKSRLRMVLETAQSELDVWSKSASSQLDAQLIERRRQFIKRVEAIERIQQAAGDLGERLREIELDQIALEKDQAELRLLTQALLDACPSGGPSLGLPNPTGAEDIAKPTHPPDAPAAGAVNTVSAVGAIDTLAPGVSPLQTADPA